MKVLVVDGQVIDNTSSLLLLYYTILLCLIIHKINWTYATNLRKYIQFLNLYMYFVNYLSNE